MWGIEEMLYLIVGSLLLVAALLAVIGTVKGIDAIDTHQNAVDTGVVVLDPGVADVGVAELRTRCAARFCAARSS